LIRLFQKIEVVVRAVTLDALSLQLRLLAPHITQDKHWIDVNLLRTYFVFDIYHLFYMFLRNSHKGHIEDCSTVHIKAPPIVFSVLEFQYEARAFFEKLEIFN
jgi:hypothetical protein